MINYFNALQREEHLKQKEAEIKNAAVIANEKESKRGREVFSGEHVSN